MHLASRKIVDVAFHPATSAYLSNGTCQHYCAYAEAYIRDDERGPGNFVSVAQSSDETDTETMARARGMFLQGTRGMFGFGS